MGGRGCVYVELILLLYIRATIVGVSSAGVRSLRVSWCLLSACVVCRQSVCVLIVTAGVRAKAV